MKPHEERWDSAEDFEIAVLGPELDRGIDGPRETLARAAPDIALALLDHVRRCEGCGGSGQAMLRTATFDVRGDCPMCKSDRAALKKAGVLP